MADNAGWVVNLLSAGLAYSTPLMFTTLGEVIAERAGVLNLGLDGLMLVGAMSGVMAGLWTGSAWMGLLVAAGAACALSLVHAFLSVGLRADQVVSGLSLGFLGTGLASMLGAPLVGMQGGLDRFMVAPIPLLHQAPGLGPILFEQGVLTYVALLACPLIWWLLNRTRWGLHLRAVGENPQAADSLGVRVASVRYVAVAVGGALAGVGGASLSLAIAPGYVDGMTAGMGFVALGLTIFTRWNPLWVAPGAWLFGSIRRLALDLQGIGIPALADPNLGYFFNMLPYLFVVVVLVVAAMQRRNQCGVVTAPAALGIAYVRGKRR